MIQVKNVHRNKKLFFEILGKPIGIGPGEVISVGNKEGKVMLESPWIINNLAGSCPKCVDAKKTTERPKSFESPETSKIKEPVKKEKESVKKESEKISEDKKIRFKKVEKNN